MRVPDEVVFMVAKGRTTYLGDYWKKRHRFVGSWDRVTSPCTLVYIHHTIHTRKIATAAGRIISLRRQTGPWGVKRRAKCLIIAAERERSMKTASATDIARSLLPLPKLQERNTRRSALLLQKKREKMEAMTNAEEIQPLLGSSTHSDQHREVDNGSSSALLVDFDPQGDADNPMDWPTAFKWSVVALLAAMAFTVYVPPRIPGHQAAD